jgi:hypothetical protein
VKFTLINLIGKSLIKLLYALLAGFIKLLTQSFGLLLPVKLYRPSPAPLAAPIHIDLLWI